MRPKIQWCLPVFFLVACASTGKPLVDLTTLVDPAPNPSIVRFEATNPFNRLYVGPVSAIDQPEWLEALKALRERDRKVLAQKNVDSVYERAELAWTQTSFIETPLMIHDRFLYDPATHHYTADRLLSDLKFRYGGAETVVLWQAYPNLGIDERNQYDFFRDLPGGIAGLKSLIAAFHRRGVKVILPFLPWDNGTRPEGEETRAAAAAKLVATTGADGLFGDSMAAPGPEFLDAGEKLDHVFALEPEGGFGNSIQAILWAPMSWANWSDYQSVPGVDRYRWIEPRFMNHVGRREAHSHLDELQYAWFNGAGFLPWENVWGTWNGITPRDAETIRRMAMIYRAIPDFVRSANWEPHSAVLQSKDVYASKWSLPDSGTVWTFINRGDEDLSGPMLEVNFRAQHFYNLWTGEEIKPAEKLINRLAHKAQLELSLDAHGFGAVLETNEPPIVGSSVARLLPAMRARKNMHIFSSDWVYTPQRMVDVPATAKFATAPAGMIRIPGIQGWDFSVTGIENGAFDGADVQYPWESHPQLVHQVSRDIATFYLDQMPVTNQQFQQFLDDHGYTPADSHNFLRDWDHGRMPPAIANKAVTWVSLEDARAYCHAAGKRLPREWEWQYAGQGPDGRDFPWGQTWDSSRVPVPDTGRSRRPGPDVGSYPEGASPFGVLDMQGLVWQWTDEFYDQHTRAAVLKGGSYYQPAGSKWYFPTTSFEGAHPELRGRHRLNGHAKYLLMDPSIDRAGTIGFRCAADAAN